MGANGRNWGLQAAANLVGGTADYYYYNIALYCILQRPEFSNKNVSGLQMYYWKEKQELR